MNDEIMNSNRPIENQVFNQPVLRAENIIHSAQLMGYYTPNKKFACFELYFQIINTFLKNTCILIENCPKNSKIALKFKYAKRFLSYFDCLDP